MSKRAWILLIIGIVVIVGALLVLLNITRYKSAKGTTAFNYDIVYFGKYKVRAVGQGDTAILRQLHDTRYDLKATSEIIELDNTPYLTISVDQEQKKVEVKTECAKDRSFVVINHNTKQKETLSQDPENKLILRDESGKALWQRVLDGQIVGGVTQIDYYNNKKLQYLFATKNYIHLVDRNGNNTANFPINKDILTFETRKDLITVDSLGNIVTFIAK